jgi:hypothetical protein
MSALEGHPPGAILLATKIVDDACHYLQCSGWRQGLLPLLGDQSRLSSWISVQVPSFQGSVSQRFPDLLSYKDFALTNSTRGTLSNLFRYAFHTRDTQLGILTSYEAMLALLLLVLLLRQIKATLMPIFQRAGRSLGCAAHGKEWDTLNTERVTKFGEYVFRLLYHSVISILGLVYFWNLPWFRFWENGTLMLWMDHPRHEIGVGLTWYYLIQSAYNIEAIVHLTELSFDIHLQSPFNVKLCEWQSPLVCRWSPTCRGDFREMAIHHVITNALIMTSSFFRFTRIGSMVFVLHDLSDVPVDMSKLANFVKWKTATTFSFIALLIFWVLLRLLALPLVIIKTVLYEGTVHMGTIPLGPFYYHLAYLTVFKILLLSIFFLHIVWFIILVRIALRLALKGEAHDLSEHKKGEDHKIQPVNSLISLADAASSKSTNKRRTRNN